MSKQDIEKRLGFAAQGVKETTRTSAKARFGGHDAFVVTQNYNGSATGTIKGFDSLQQVQAYIKERRAAIAAKATPEEAKTVSWTIYKTIDEAGNSQSVGTVKFARPGVKAKMAKRMVVDTITSGNQKHELGYESVMQPVAAGEPPHEWFRPIVRTTNLDTGKSSEKASQPHYTEKSARDWLKNYASSVRPSTDPLYAEYASNREKISKMMTRLAQARNNPELRQKLQVESDKLDARQREVAAQLQKRKSSRPGVKAKMAASDIIVKENAQYIYYYPEDDARATFADDNGKGAYTVKSNRTGKPVSAKTYRSFQEAAAASNEMNEKLPPLKKAKSARPGVKAKFATEVGRKGNKSAMISRDATGTWYAYVVQRIETGIGKDEDMLGTMRAYSTEDRAKRAAIKALDTSGFSRPGVKAKA